MESISGSMLQGSLDIQANAAAKLIGGAPAQTPAPQGVDEGARAAGLQAQGKGQKLDIVG